MVYNEKMDLKLNELVSKWKNLTKKKMFGGTGYLVNGNMVVGIHKDYYILRLGVKNAITAMKLPKTKAFDITGRPMKGWIMAEEGAFNDVDDLKNWLAEAKEFVDTLPVD
ncbi:MAG: TfoX/Sxy family protein [Promethearchaeota archaeon]|jgi:TfoX/Sxy family transcriptional regulator of competence genes